MFTIQVFIKDIIFAFLTGFIAAIPLGPSGIEAISQCINYGFKEGIKVSLGAVMADLLYIIVINFGLLNILYESNKVYGMFWIILGLFLIILNVLTNNENGKMPLPKIRSKYRCSGFFSGFLITFINPTTISLWIFFSGTIFPKWRLNGQLYFLIIILFMICGSMTWFILLNLLVCKGISFVQVTSKSSTSKILRYIMFMLGIIFIFIGSLKCITSHII